MKKIINIARIFAVALLLLLAFYLEEPIGMRQWILGILSLLLWSSFISTLKIEDSLKFRSMIFIFQVIVLIVLEYNGKYAVNYFYHIIYLIIILDLVMLYQPRIGITSSLIVTFLSFVKFIQLVTIEPTFANLSLSLFFGSFQILMVITGGFFKVYFHREKKTQHLYNELYEAHEQLKVYSGEIKKLTVAKERNQIARDLHDTLGHELMGVIMQMEMAESCFKDLDRENAMQLLSQAKDSARESLVKVREIVVTLKEEQPRLSHDSIKVLVEKFTEKTGCQVSMEGEHFLEVLNLRQYEVLYRLIQESLTNAVRHGKATRVTIRFYKMAGCLDFHIHDNGKSQPQLVENQGLKGMRERMVAISGQLTINPYPVFTIEGKMSCEEV